MVIAQRVVKILFLVMLQEMEPEAEGTHAVHQPGRCNAGAQDGQAGSAQDTSIQR